MRRGPERSSQLSLSAPDSLGLYYRAVEDGDLPPLPMPWISPPSRFLGAKGATRPRPIPGGPRVARRGPVQSLSRGPPPNRDGGPGMPWTARRRDREFLRGLGPRVYIA